ncbi:Hypothetical predicted protein [Pelobates cultripes]|uniref:L1 transposable element RRM domain-containing protein n=1 Tax=Pelobates cultripes TaxID=61616 RepID=A0AAD1TEG5_PELCU|nr:Hypothetical predicted protein [Pelobates cultripes]
MGRTKFPDGSQTPRSNPTNSQAGPMDDYLQTLETTSRKRAGLEMVASPNHVRPPEAGSPTLSDISALAAQMVTKTDLQTLSDDLHTAIRLEVTALRSEITAPSGRFHIREETMQETTGRVGTTTTAVTRQGNLLLALRRQAEDLDNRGRRSNIRVRGLPEPQTEEDIETTLKALFRDILGEDNVMFDRAHRANRPRIPDGTPRDAICCLHHYKHNEQIMLKARTRLLWRFRGADVTLFQDLSPFSLEARRALCPITSLLPERGITDWILGPLEQRPRPQTPRQQRHRRGESPRRPITRRHLDPAAPEE